MRNDPIGITPVTNGSNQSNGWGPGWQQFGNNIRNSLNGSKPVQTQNNRLTQAANLVSIPTLVEAPFIYVTIGKYTFGLPSKIKGSRGQIIIDYPNFMNSLTVTKVNGEVNTYQLRMTYQIK